MKLTDFLLLSAIIVSAPHHDKNFATGFAATSFVLAVVLKLFGVDL